MLYLVQVCPPGALVANFQCYATDVRVDRRGRLRLVTGWRTKHEFDVDQWSEYTVRPATVDDNGRPVALQPLPGIRVSHPRQQPP